MTSGIANVHEVAIFVFKNQKVSPPISLAGRVFLAISSLAIWGMLLGVGFWMTCAVFSSLLRRSLRSMFPEIPSGFV